MEGTVKFYNRKKGYLNPKISKTKEKKTMLIKFNQMLRNKKGQGLVEYALILAVVAVLIIAALVTFRGQIAAVLARIGTQLNPPA